MIGRIFDSGIRARFFLAIMFPICLMMRAEAGNLYPGFTVLNSNNGLSNGAVNVIFQDNEGIMWFGTWDGLNSYDGADFTQFRPKPDSGTSISHQVIRSIFEDGRGNLWVITDYGINRMDRIEGTFSRYFLDFDYPVIYEEQLFSCCISSEGAVVAALKGHNGVYIYNADTDSFRALACEGCHISSVMFFDSLDRLWARSVKGDLLVLDFDGTSLELVRSMECSQQKEFFYDGRSRIWSVSDDRTLEYICTEDNMTELIRTGISLPGTLNTIKDCGGDIIIGTNIGCYGFRNGSLHKILDADIPVLSVFKGTQDILWIGTDGKGILQWSSKSGFVSSLESGAEKFPEYPVRAILKDSYGNIWLGRKGAGLTCIGPDGITEKVFNVGPGRSYNSVFSIAQGHSCIWVGTDGPGLWLYDFTTGDLLKADIPEEYEKLIYSVYSIVQYDRNTLYVGTSGEGLFRLTLDGKSITSVDQYRYSEDNSKGIGGNIVYALVPDGDCLWVATRGGGVSRFNVKTSQSEVFRKMDEGLCSNDVISLLKDTSGFVWIGTTSGLNLMTQDDSGHYKFRTFNENDGLTNTNIHSILEDAGGNIWVSTSNGIARIAGNTFAITNFYHEDGLLSNEFSDGAGFFDKGSNELYFGCIDGVNIIHPDKSESPGFIPGLVVARIKVDNEIVRSSDGVVRTDFKTGSITFDLSVTDYLDNRKCQIAYCILKGRNVQADEDEFKWINIGSDRRIILSRLSPGNYSLYVRHSNSEQEWQSPSKFMIHVSPPVLQRWWAVCIYVLVFAVLIYIVFVYYRYRTSMRMALEQEKHESLKREEIHQAKLRFFTNIAHEFSNSITLIFGAVEQIFLTGDVLDSRFRKQLVTIRRNADRMHNQIQELMEFRKIDTDNLEISYEKVDVEELIKYTFDNFMDVADSKNVHVAFDFQPGLPQWVVDRGMLEKIIFNLVSNAMKYTPDYGEITIISRTDGDGRLMVSVVNSGPGIPQEKLSDVFNRFTILDNFESKLSRGLYTRNGIGLALCKDLVTLMGGSITVDSRENEFTVFSISLPFRDVPETTEKESPVRLPMKTTMERLTDRKYVVMIVDDQPEIRNLVQEILEDDYETIQASDGESALGKLNEVSPALIICDIVMPGMNGVEFIRKVKSDDKTRYVPLIVLSCNSSIDSHVTVLETGADMFISKPFHPRYLKAAVDRLLDNNKMMRSYSGTFASTLEKFSSLDISKDDWQFVERVLEVLSKNYADENYNQDSLACDLAISRVHLYRKIKQILMMTPGDFIRNFRLVQAENMLIHSDKTVQEIMYDCGFHNKAYFYREFSRVYNSTPKDFRTNNMKKGKDRKE